ncbi:hypothetical protein GQ600_9617 [Phytophthora cactorum]|nr:hypothetical protein GQ600_9617 [Phytophthora cactorum]
MESDCQARVDKRAIVEAILTADMAAALATSKAGKAGGLIASSCDGSNPLNYYPLPLSSSYYRIFTWIMVTRVKGLIRFTVSDLFFLAVLASHGYPPYLIEAVRYQDSATTVHFIANALDAFLCRIDKDPRLKYIGYITRPETSNGGHEAARMALRHTCIYALGLMELEVTFGKGSGLLLNEAKKMIIALDHGRSLDGSPLLPTLQNQPPKKHGSSRESGLEPSPPYLVPTS